MPCATYASQGVDRQYEVAIPCTDRSWLNTDRHYWDKQVKQEKTVFYLRSESVRSGNTDVPALILNDHYPQDRERARFNSVCSDSLNSDLDQDFEDDLHDSTLENTDYGCNVDNYDNSNYYYETGISVDAYPDSLITWPPKNTTKSKRLAEIKKQVKQLSSIIKMTIANDVDNGGAANGDNDHHGNPAPFSKYVDMNLIESKDFGINSEGANLPVWKEIKQHLTTEHFKEAKQMLRESDYGLSHQIRGELWIELCKHQSSEVFTEQFYWDTVKQMYGTTVLSECNTSLPAFVDHNHICNHALSSQGIEACQRIMSVVGFINPSITYGPLVYPLTALMLHYMEEVDAYNCITALIATPNNRYITQTKVNHESLWRATIKLARKHVRGSFSTLIKYGVTPEQVDSSFQDYLWWIMEDIPLPHLVRIMDCFLLEGSKVLLRCSLAIMHIFGKQVTRDSGVAATLPTRGVQEAIAKFCKGMTASPSKLLKTAFGIRGFSKTEINQVLLKTEMTLKSNRMVTGVDPTTDRPSLSRSASLEGLPTSAAQSDVQMMSHTMTIRELLTVWSWLPIRKTMHQPILLYTTEEHGSSLTTFYQRTEKHYPTLLLIRTTTEQVFGAYCSTAFEERNIRDQFGHRQTYFGTGESFVFSLKPNVAKFQWVGITQQQENKELSTVDHSSELFIHADNDMISIGGGNGQAIYLDHELRFGKTEHCQTFDNPPLCPEGDFEVKVIEVYGLTEPF